MYLVAEVSFSWFVWAVISDGHLLLRMYLHSCNLSASSSLQLGVTVE